MLIGNPGSFAIESEIAEAYERLSFRALGYFVVHIGGVAYGVREPHATMLACAFDNVEQRLRHRGGHRLVLSMEVDAVALASAVELARFGAESDGWRGLGYSARDLRERLSDRKIVWAPGGDEEWDDGSRIVQLDVDQRVRLLGFKLSEERRVEPELVSEVWLDSERFYGVLDQWLAAFECEWAGSEKIPEAIDQSWESVAAWRLARGMARP